MIKTFGIERKEEIHTTLVVHKPCFFRHPAKTFNVFKLKSNMPVWCSVFVIYTCRSNTVGLCFCWKEKQTENNRRNHRALPGVLGFVQRQGWVCCGELSNFPCTSCKRDSPSTGTGVMCELRAVCLLCLGAKEWTWFSVFSLLLLSSLQCVQSCWHKICRTGKYRWLNSCLSSLSSFQAS